MPMRACGLEVKGFVSVVVGTRVRLVRPPTLS